MSLRRIYRFILKYQVYLIGAAVFFFGLSVAFSFDGKRIELIWRDNPLYAISILITGLFFIGLYIKFDKLKLKYLTRKLEAHNEVSEDRMNNIHGLTQRQKEVLGLILKGLSNKEICSNLYIEASTLKTHINHIYRQLEVRCRRELRLIYGKNQGQH